MYEVGDVMDAVDIIVSCSEREAISRVLLEAGISGIAAVATNVGGVPDVIRDGDTGFLCKPGDVTALTRSVNRLLTDGALRRNMGAHARDFVSNKFSISTCTERLIDAYREVLC